MMTGVNAALLIVTLSGGLMVATAAASWQTASQTPPAPARAPTQTSSPAAADPASPAPPLDPEAVKRGRAVFLENCVACHGQDATGGSDANTDLTRSQVIHDDVEGKQFAKFIAEGRPDQRMPGFALEAKNVKDLATYLHSISVLKAKPASESSHP
jgi:mono/diheme cytochrome c family protein